MLKSYGWYPALLLATATGFQLSSVGEQDKNVQAWKSSSHGIDDFDSHFSKVGDAKKMNEVPIFFHFPKCGGTSMKAYMRNHLHFNVVDVGRCLKLAKQNGATQPAESCALEVHAQISEGNAAISLTDLDAAAKVFSLSSNYVGRIFTMIRHPVDRAVSNYYYCRVATWENCYEDAQRYPTLASAVEEKAITNNPYTRVLSTISDKGYDLDAAKEVLQNFFLIGLTEHYTESTYRFKQFFTSPAADFVEFREENVPKTNSNSHPSLHPGEPLWHQIATFVADDIHLYDLAKKLFHEQAHLYE